MQGAHGQGFAYTLRGLTEALGLVTKQREHPAIEAALSTRPEKHAGLSAAGKKGWLALYRYFLADVEVLLRLRGGGFHSNRHRSLYLYATILRRNRMSESDVEHRVMAAARASRPDATGSRLTDAEARQAVKQAFKGRAIPLSANRLYLEFKVTDIEATYLFHIHPPHVAAPVLAKPRTTAERHAAIRERCRAARRQPAIDS